MKRLTFKKLPHQDHADLLDDLETMSSDAYAFVVSELIKEVVAALARKKLAKSDDLKRGWTGEVPKIEADFGEILDKVLSKYMDALKYILLGPAAGADARRAAKAIGLDQKVLPGLIQSAYLDSIDTHIKYGEELGEEPGTIPTTLLNASMDQINVSAGRFVDESILKFKNRILSTVELGASEQNNDNIATIHEKAHELLADGQKKVLATAASEATGKLDAKDLAAALRVAVDGFKPQWMQMTSADVQLASAVGTHQAVSEIYGRDDDDVRVAWVAMRDEKTCHFCKDASKNKDGSYKLYRLSDLKPAGYNYGKRKPDWRLCIPGAHPNCRCTLVYIPRGFMIDKDGSVAPIPKA